MGESQPVVTSEGARSQPYAGSLLAFFSFTFVVTWTCFIAVIRGGLPAVIFAPLSVNVLLYLGIFAPSLVALGLTARAEQGAGVRALLGRLFKWEVGARWYVFALGYMAAIKLVDALVYRLVTGAWPALGREALYIMLAAIPISTVTQAGEEIGWRGYALPRLAARFGLGFASILLGVLWAFWHLPLFYLPGADTFGQSFVAYLLQVTALSVVIAWLYWRTQGSLLLVMLMHAAINNTKDIVPSVARATTNPFSPSASLMTWLGVAVLWIPAAYFLVRMRQARLSLTPP